MAVEFKVGSIELKDINDIRREAKLNIKENIFSKDKLKKIFIFNYKNGYGAGRITALHNAEYQCFRNAAFYLLLRCQKQLWNLINTLPIEPSDVIIGNSNYLNKYLVIQSLIELMDDEIIKKLITDAMSPQLQEKRRIFLDDRLEYYKGLAPQFKYQNLGVIGINGSNKNAYFADKAVEMEMSVEACEQLMGLAGGHSSNVINFLITRIFTNDNIYLKNDVKTFDEMKTNITIQNKNYLLYKFVSSPPTNKQPTAESLFRNINNYTLVQNSRSQNYKLVGILYDCGDHQLTSVCFGAQCISSSHNFIDDEKITMDKSLNPDRYTPGFNTGLNYGCRNAQNLLINYILYENVNAVSELNCDIRRFCGRNNIKIRDLVIHGGSGSDNYKTKYLKYKAKYLYLKKVDL